MKAYKFFKFYVILVLCHVRGLFFFFLIISCWIYYYYCKICSVNTLCITSPTITLLDFIFFQCVQKVQLSAMIC